MEIFQKHEAGWARIGIPTEGLSLRRAEHGVELRAGQTRDALAWVIPFREGGRAQAALLVPALPTRLLVNGYRPFGLTVLGERDEILAYEETLYFTARRPAVLSRFGEGEPPVPCGRCGGRLGAGDLVVRCPSCGSQHHEGVPARGDAPLRCWSFDAECGACRQPLDQMLWSPEEEAP
jgi:hypothetical protein